MKSIIEVRDLRVSFDGFVVLDGISFRLAKGDSFGLVGESGSGKSTILRAITGLAPIEAGYILLENHYLDSKRDPEFYRSIQMVFQDPFGSLHPRQTVDRALLEPLRIHGLDNTEGRIRRALDEVGLGLSFRYRYPHQLSGGQRQRVAIARALILEPSILLLDEPTSALDVSVQAEVLNLLDRIRRDRELSYIMVSHDLAVITHMCDRLLVLNGGQAIEEVGSADLASGRVQSDYTRKLVSASAGFRGRPAALTLSHDAGALKGAAGTPLA
ncbi:ABC transporter ATP-binding protein [Bradyrhizobium sp.]|uniref:ABC transporter ATP-binding protein n=1 Tax=Bradyrhizobium sp. TaxID=376 RepID=UPI0039E55F87